MIYAEDLNEKIDISGLPIFEIKEVTTEQTPYVVTCKELIDMLDRLNKNEDKIQIAKIALAKKLNVFVDRKRG